MDKVTGQCPQTTTLAEAVWNRGPSAYQPNALPLGQTAECTCVNPFVVCPAGGIHFRADSIRLANIIRALRLLWQRRENMGEFSVPELTYTRTFVLQTVVLFKGRNLPSQNCN